MYIKIKNTLKAILPKGFIYKHESKLRFILYQFYHGSNFYCNICDKDLRRFMKLADGDKLCPSCGSLARNRRLWDILQSDYLKEKLKVLDFSPSRNLYRILKENTAISYTSTDFSGEFLADKQYDITHIDLPDNSFDLIICYHILEHVENDLKAIAELHRVLRTDGICMIQTPFKEGNIYENLLIRTPKERIKHFGQVDHVRIYSVDGLKNRLLSAGFQVAVKEYTEPNDNKFGFKEKEYIIIAKKTN